MQHCLGKENALGAGGGVERVALIKSLIYTRKKDYAQGAALPSSAEKSQLILCTSVQTLSKLLEPYYMTLTNSKAITGL